MSHDSGGRRRLFFALRPSARRRALLLTCREHWGCAGRPVHPLDLHLTLLFLGGCREPDCRALLAGAASLRGEPFSLLLDRSGYWPGSRTLWLAPQVVPQALSRLVRDLRRLARRQGLKVPPRSYQPHLTLFRDAGPGQRCPPQPPQPPHWRVRDFVLLESPAGVAFGDGPRYRELGHWPAA